MQAAARVGERGRGVGVCVGATLLLCGGGRIWRCTTFESEEGANERAGHKQFFWLNEFYITL